jgi:opacity protein-like surface antigen
MKKIAIAVLLSAFVATPAVAADNTGKYYIAGDLGTTTYSNMSPFPNPGVVRIAGGYHFSPSVAAEIGYSMFGDSTINYGFGSSTLTASSFQIAAVGSLPLSPEFDLIGKLGLSNNSAKITDTFLGSASTSQSSLLIGLGAQYHINSQVSMRLLYDNYGKFDNVSPEMKATSVSLGVAYNF